MDVLALYVLFSPALNAAVLVSVQSEAEVTLSDNREAWSSGMGGAVPLVSQSICQQSGLLKELKHEVHGNLEVNDEKR